MDVGSADFAWSKNLPLVVKFKLEKNMKSKKIYPVILSGGSGTRLWPMSRSAMPKQFLPLMSEKSLFIETLIRVADKDMFHAPIIVGNAEHNYLIMNQLKEANIEAGAIILEPVAKNTAPAIALAAYHILNTEPDSIMLVMPSDHMSDNDHNFYDAIELANTACHRGNMVTFGIKPDYPETGYGYIEYGSELLAHNKIRAFNLNRFVEKPKQAAAEEMLAQGNYYWNSGIFMFSALQYINELAKKQPDMVVEVNKAYLYASHNNNVIKPEENYFNASPAESIDYAVMEHTNKGVVVEGLFKWFDAGSWLSLWDNNEKDKANNVVSGDVMTDSTTECYIRGGKRLISTINVHDLVIVDTDDALLIANKKRSQDVKTVVNNLNLNSREEANQPATVRRPWGTYTSIDQGLRHQVKHITVEPGGVLSKQYHHHRSEHWIVVHGVAEVEVGDKELMLDANESVYIPKGEVHRLTNNGKETLNLIEVQCGTYLGEDDIVRLEDNYGRVEQAADASMLAHTNI